jgi:hypothetical protein
MAKMTKAQARKRLNEAYAKITNVMRAGFLTPAQWVKLTEQLNREIKKLE